MKRRLFLAAVAVALLPLTRVFAQDPLTNDLVAFYRFDGNLDDSSGNGNDGALIGYDWKYAFDRFGSTNALYLNTTSTPSAGIDGTFAIAPRSAALDFNQDFTLAVWVNISSTVSNYYVHNLISNGLDTNSANFRIISDASTNGMDYLQFICNHTDGDVHSFVPRVRDSWWHAVAVRSGTNVSLFRNGVLLATSPMTASMENTASLWLGRYDCGGGCPSSYSLIGGIDEVRMYNRALSALEVQQLYRYEANPLPYLTAAVKTIRLTLYVEVGTSNQLYSSTQLRNWTPYGPPFAATNSIMYQDVDVTGYQQYFDIRLVPSVTAATLTLTNQANQISSDSLRVVAYLNNSGSPIAVGSWSGTWNPQQTWSMQLSALTVGQAYTFELQDTSFSNAVFPPRSNQLILSPGESLSGYVYNTGSGGYFGWYTKWAWGP